MVLRDRPLGDPGSGGSSPRSSPLHPCAICNTSRRMVAGEPPVKGRRRLRCGVRRVSREFPPAVIRAWQPVRGRPSRRRSQRTAPEPGCGVLTPVVVIGWVTGAPVQPASPPAHGQGARGQRRRRTVRRVRSATESATRSVRPDASRSARVCRARRTAGACASSHRATVASTAEPAREGGVPRAWPSTAVVSSRCTA